MKINELILQLIAGGLLGMFGQVIRMFVGLTKAYKNDTDFSLSRLLSSLVVGFSAGGIGIFTLTNWQPDATLYQGDIVLLLSIGYAGTDFLEGIFRSMVARTGTADGTGIDIQAIYSRIAETEKLVQVSLQQNTNDNTTSIPVPKAVPPPDQVQLNYINPTDALPVSRYAAGVVGDILRRSGHSSATITSTERTPERQANAMYQNLITKGAASQRRLYGPYGDSVIDVYESAVKAGKSAAQIKQEMADRMRAIGSEKFSRHMGDFRKLVVVDISPKSIANHQAFREAVRFEEQNGRVSKSITNLVDDPAFHLEIPNKETSSVLASNGNLQEQYIFS